MHRRGFLLTPLAAVVTAPLAIHAQPTPKVWRIGYLFEQAELQPVMKVHEERLRELSDVEGRNLVVEHGLAASRYDRLPELAAELVRLKPDVIVTASNPAATSPD